MEGDMLVNTQLPGHDFQFAVFKSLVINGKSGSEPFAHHLFQATISWHWLRWEDTGAFLSSP